jgi:hypothetical protein
MLPRRTKRLALAINPYESPQVPHRQPRHRSLYRNFGVGAILSLTPPAMVVAVGTTCTAGQHLQWLPPILVLFGIPLGVLSLLMLGAILIDRRRPDDPNGAFENRIGYFLATPVVVAIAMLVGYAVACAIVLVSGALSGGLTQQGFMAGAIVFWLIPSIALLTMLWLSWR